MMLVQKAKELDLEDWNAVFHYLFEVLFMISYKLTVNAVSVSQNIRLNISNIRLLGAKNVFQ